MKDVPERPDGDRQLKIVVGLLAILEFCGIAVLVARWMLL
jgi:hypothetical protein